MFRACLKAQSAGVTACP